MDLEPTGKIKRTARWTLKRGSEKARQMFRKGLELNLRFEKEAGTKLG